MEMIKELMVVSPTPATLSSAIVAAQLPTRLLLIRTEYEFVDGQTSTWLVNASGLDGASPGSVCVLDWDAF